MNVVKLVGLSYRDQAHTGTCLFLPTSRIRLIVGLSQHRLKLVTGPNSEQLFTPTVVSDLVLVEGAYRCQVETMLCDWCGAELTETWDRHHMSQCAVCGNLTHRGECF